MENDEFNYLGSHDQNFKNLTVDYPIQAIEFFAHSVYPKIEGNPKVTFLRQESSKERLSVHHREMDVPILLEWELEDEHIASMDGKAQRAKRKKTIEKAIIIFAIEAESNPYKFDAVRLAQYSLDLAKQHKTSRVVPVVVFTAPGKFQKQLQLGTERVDVMQFNFVYCQLSQLDYRDWRSSNNIVARLTLPFMRHEQQEKVELVKDSLQGLFELENDDSKQGKYIEFIEYYGKLTEQEINEFNKRYPQEGNTMSSYYQRLYQEKIQKGREEALEKGLEKGQRLVLLRQMKKRFAQELTAFYEDKILSASLADIEQWADNILDAKTVDDVFA